MSDSDESRFAPARESLNVEWPMADIIAAVLAEVALREAPGYDEVQRMYANEYEFQIGMVGERLLKAMRLGKEGA